MSIITPTQPVISITENSAEQVRHLQAENAGKQLRVYVEQGGCSGMQYGLVFDEPRDGDLKAEMHGVCVLVDPVSADHVRGCGKSFQA